MNLQVAHHVDYADRLEEMAVVNLPDMRRLEVLTQDKTREVLDFLSVRPVHTVVMTGFIRDNGLESELNRGTFHGYRNAAGELEGVALIGHTTLVEARSDESTIAFALTARESEIPVYVMMSDGDSIERFWNFYNLEGAEPRMLCTEKLFELKFPFPVRECAWDVRPAATEEIEQIAVAHAEVAYLESGTNPLERDPEGFMDRCRRRIEKGRTFVVFEDGRLVFKADIVAETNDVIYLEGVYVAPEYRGRGIAPECLSKLCTMLLERVENICMLSNLKFEAAHRSFEKAGFRSDDACTTIFV